MSDTAQGGAPRRIDPQNPPYPQLRALMRTAYNAKTLTRLAQHPGFSELQYRIGLNADLDDLIDEVFELARTRLMWEELLDAVAADSPRAYNILAGQQGWDLVPEPEIPSPDPTAVGPVSSDQEDRGEEKPEPRGEVEIHVADRLGDSYRIHLRSPAGEAESTLTLPWTKERQALVLAALEQQGALLDSVVEGDMRPTDANALVRIGRKLFGALFSGNVERRYAAAADGTSGGLRVRLRIDPPEVQALPWELLYDDERHHFLALQGKSLITRYLPVAYGPPPLAVEPPLKILLFTACPKGYVPLDVEAEVAGILGALEGMVHDKQVQVEVVRHAQLMSFRNKLLTFRPHVVHFIGHGQADRQGGYLALEKPDATPFKLDGPKLANLLSSTSVRVAVLNACLTARGAAVEVEDFYQLRHALLGLGPALIGAGLGAVVAMQFSMRDLSARVFAEDFYRSLARLDPVDEAVWLGRQLLMLQFDEEQRDWATPVLFLRSPDGVIFRRS